MINNQINRHFGRTGNRLFQLAFIYGQARRGNIGDLYVQQHEFFDKYRTELQAMFRQEGEPLDFVSIHVRRGKNPSVPEEPNYSDNSFYVDLCTTSYYEMAMAEFPGEKFLIFTDDKDWCLENFMGDHQVISVSEDHDFNMMARCKGHVIANSTFSWWASYLSGKRTVAPEKWFTDEIKRVTYPADWKVL